MARQKKASKALNINLDVEIYRWLEEYCNETGLTKTAAVERALQKQLEHHTPSSSHIIEDGSR